MRPNLAIRPPRVHRTNRLAYLYILPGFLIYTGLIIYSFIRTISMSLYQGWGTPVTTFVGFGNYRDLFADPAFWNSFRNNVIWAGIAVVFPMTFGLVLAVILAQSKLIGRTFFRAVLFLPQILTPVIVATVWGWMYNPVFGSINQFLGVIGLESLARGWLGDHAWALPALGIAYSWAYYGFCMVVFVAALQGVDVTLYDAAKVDGANALQQFRYVTVPTIRFAITTVLLFTLIESFKIFDIVFVATHGGPGYSTWVLSYYLYDYTWNQRLVGHGLASAVVQTMFVALLSATFLWYRHRSEEANG
jgi:raffinose/stachyose/melibiose transport system permease protein